MNEQLAVMNQIETQLAAMEVRADMMVAEPSRSDFNALIKALRRAKIGILALGIAGDESKLLRNTLDDIAAILSGEEK